MIGHRKRNVQRGRGLGSILSSLFSKIAPFARTLFNIGTKVVKSAPAQEVIKSAKNEALKTGIQVADDVLKGKNVKESIRSNVENAAKNVASSAISQAKKRLNNDLNPGEISNKKQKSSKKKRKKKVRRPDIFQT